MVALAKAVFGPAIAPAAGYMAEEKVKERRSHTKAFVVAYIVTAALLAIPTVVMPLMVGAIFLVR